MTPTTSVLLPYRDAADTLGEALASALADLEPTGELVAVDDGSRDDGPSIVAAAAARDARVTALAAGGVGVAGALARGLEIARAELVARMDADDVTLPGRFAAERALLASDARLGAVGVAVEAFGDVGEGTARYLAWQNALVSPEDHARSIYVESPLCHPSTMIRRAALEAVGGFLDPPWPEDWDLWLRMHRAGYRLAKVPRVLFRWRRHAGAVTRRDPRCAPERLREARARYLADDLAARGAPFAVWGAGQTGRRLARALEARGARAAFFVDIDPRKVGRTARGAPIVAADDGIARAAREGAVIVVAVGEPGARDVVRERLGAAGVAEGAGFVCAA